MDAKTRAEKITQFFRVAFKDGDYWTDLTNEIAAQISEAEDGAELRAYRLSDETWKKRLEEACAEAVRDKVIEMCEGENSFVAQKCQDAYAQGCADTLHNSPMFEEGFRAAREKAVGIAMLHQSIGHICDDPKEIADRIKGMEP